MPWNSPKRPPYWNSTSDFDFDVDMSLCTMKLYPNRTTLSRKKMTSCRFSRWQISAILDFKGAILGSLKSQCTTSYRSSIDTIALNCLLSEKIAFFAFWRQTDEEMDSTDALSRSCCRERRLNN